MHATMAGDSTHQYLQPPTLSALNGPRRGKRACTECSRKKSKCDMVLPVCSLCVRTDSICLFPTTRKPRTLGRRRHHKRVDGAEPDIEANVDNPRQAAQDTHPNQSAGTTNPVRNTSPAHDGPGSCQLQSYGSDLANPDIRRDLFEDLILEQRHSQRNASFDSNFAMFMQDDNGALERDENGRREASPQQSTTAAENTQTSNNTNSRTSDIAYDAITPDSSQNLIPAQLNPPGDMLSTHFDVLGPFDPCRLPFFSMSMFNGELQAPDHYQTSGMAAYGDWNSSNIDWQSLVPESQRIGSPQIGLSLHAPPQVSNSERVRETSERPENAFGLEIPASLIVEMIEIFFDKIHSFLPLFHKHGFTESEISNQASNNPQSLPLETSLILHGMLALSARFSSSPLFDGIKPPQRGDRFGQRAKAIYDNSIRAIRQPNLRYLQGCILLAFYLYSCEPDSQGWLVIGACSRLAYDLGLNKIDDDYQSDSAARTISNLEWSEREELRRAWWCVWELDTFASAIACRPPTIDSSKMQVLLPVSDHTWFANVPVESAIIDPNPLVAWQTLRGCPNQDERAWFLVINFLLLIAYDLGQQKKPDPQRTKDIEAAVACYTLLLPPQFHLDSGSILFNSEHFRRSNWIISTNIMLQGCQTFVRFITEKASLNLSSNSKNQLLAPLAAASKFGAREMDYRPYAEQVYRCIRQWPPEYIPCNSPFIGCLVLGPAAIHMRVAKGLGSGSDTGRKPPFIEAELLKLALGHIARFWGIGSAILDLANLVANANPPVVPNGS